MQMLRRTEAKRKRSEKQRNLEAVKDRNRDSEDITSCDEIKIENGSQISNGSFGAAADGFSSKSDPSSQGSGSSEIYPVQGTNKCNIEARSPVSVQSLSECEKKFKVNPKSTANEKSLSPPESIEENRIPGKLAVKEAPTQSKFEDMPCVSTKGDGPNGRRIEGFLFRYRKGEEVRIACVCHGSFLTPAEFVKHAGGGDVTHPLKHIVVDPYPVL